MILIPNVIPTCQCFTLDEHFNIEKTFGKDLWELSNRSILLQVKLQIGQIVITLLAPIESITK